MLNVSFRFRPMFNFIQTKLIETLIQKKPVGKKNNLLDL